MLLLERPYQYNYSKNAIRYVFQLTDLTRPGLYLQVKILYADIASATFNELYTFELKPDSNGNVFFNIQNYLDSLVNYVLPSIGTMITVADEQAKQFYIEYRELTDDNYDPVWITMESDFVRTVIKGGVEKNKFDRNNIFSNYIQTQKVFLTWQPSKHFVSFNDNIYLTYLNQHVGDDLILKIVCTDVNGTVDTYLAGILSSSFLHHCNISPSFLLYPAFTTKKNYYFEISVESFDESETYVNPYRFYMEYRPAYKKMYELIYFNSLGGVDSVTISGETAVTANRDYDDTEGGIQLDWTSPVNSFEASYTNIKLQRQYKGDIGFLRTRTKKQQEAFLELFATTNIYQMIDSRWIPVVGLQKSVDLGTNNDTKQSFPIEWSLSESNEVYTPEDIMFGAGQASNVCYPVTISGSLPAGMAGVHYNAVLDVTGGTLPINAVSATGKPSWMTISYDSDLNAIVFDGTPDAAFDGTIQLTITNCTSTTIPLTLSVGSVVEPGGNLHLSYTNNKSIHYQIVFGSGAPTGTLISGNYTGDVNTTSTDLPFTGMNVQLNLSAYTGGSTHIISATLVVDGTTATPPTLGPDSAYWTGITGTDLQFTFVTD